jgi:hypothetical protein
MASISISINRGAVGQQPANYTVGAPGRPLTLDDLAQAADLVALLTGQLKLDEALVKQQTAKKFAA